MPVVRFEIDGYGQFEPNNFNAPRTGRIEAQCDLSKAEFTKTAPAEIGMLLVVDKANNLVRKFAPGDTLPLAVNYSTEHIYDERTPGLKNYYLVPGSDLHGFRPRMGYLLQGDLWTTNCIAYDTTAFANQDALMTAFKEVPTPRLYGVPSTTGAIQIVTTAPSTGAYLEVTKLTTMPDGQPGVQFRVVRAQ